jgi:hypothetical protein
MTLLNQIWGDEQGTRILMFRRGEDGAVEHEFFRQSNVAENYAAQLAETGHDVWFAPALFNKDRRKQEFVKSLNVLWLDIDAGEGKDYANVQEVDDALHAFSLKCKLPAPYYVKSGNGVHLYWLLNQRLDRDTWQGLANKLKNACVSLGLKADGACTSDSARVLRVPGTFNYKDAANPKAVELISEGEPCNVERLDGALSSFAKLTTKKEAKRINAKFSVDLPQLPKDANKIADECAQMRLMRDTRGNIPEPQWYAGLGVLALCENGEQTAHEWSNGYAKYNRDETADKFDRSKEFAPTTCERFRGVNQSLCGLCPHASRISSPIQLGEYVPRFDPTAMRSAARDVSTGVPDEAPRGETKGWEAEEVPSTYDVPKHYEVGESGVWFNAPQSKEDDKDAARQLICINPLYIRRVMLSPSNGSSEVELLWYTPHGDERSASFKQELLARPADMNAWLKSYNIGVPPKGIEPLIFYLQAGINLFNKNHREETVYDRFGWHGDAFIIGPNKITDTGSTPVRISVSVDQERLDKLSAEGDVEQWAKASEVIDKPEFWMHRFAVCAMFAAPLLRLTDSKGSVLSLSGETGAGKSAGAQFGLSAFGHPEALTIDPQSTENAFYGLLNLLGSLPMLCDEAVTMAKKDESMLGRIIYAAANGKSRDAMTRDRRLRDSGKFATVTCFTNNTHLLALPDRTLNEANRRRIFELTFDKENKMPLSVGNVLYKASLNHYGHAGRVYLEHVVKHRETLAQRYVDRLAKLETGVNGSNHYNLWLITASSIAYEIGRELKLFRFAFNDVMSKALDQIRLQDNSITPTTVKVQEAVTRYLQQYQGFITQKHAGKKGTWVESITVRGEVRARYTVEDDKTFTLCLPLKQFGEWALERNIDINHIKQWAKEKSIQQKLERIAPKTDAVQCWIIKGYTVEDYDGEGITE